MISPRCVLFNQDKTLAVCLSNEPFIVGILDNGAVTQVITDNPKNWEELRLHYLSKKFNLADFERQEDGDSAYYEVVHVPTGRMVKIEIRKSVFVAGEYDIYLKGKCSMLPEDELSRYALRAKPFVI